jgi:hypothetical protein
MSLGSGTLLFYIPYPGSKESAEKPKPSCPYMLVPQPNIFPSLQRQIECVSPQAT